ncbi:uncharacterized protein GGS22DRAFT_152137 [Annulohypoxylon maeteangense]|uniref:uncharacterized protein n=1 Tax=Annulohypoxylon maeteangense TaxID=1927788 RepID=UPI002007AF89|nr:uncharacterized protein GGS22DRAFT_152137 [Annulohypoxylon maeteangense]KAI0888670.1 hypothetical protein GGS22DRAFT_152137 [Annulohypoxylon maeteangense]
MMENTENYGLESAHRRRPSIRVVISRSNIYGTAHSTMAVPPVLTSTNPRLATIWSTDSLVGLAGMSISTPRASTSSSGASAQLLGNHTTISTKGKKRAKNLWAKLKNKFKRNKSPGPHPWRRVVSGGFGGILVGKETKVESETKLSGLFKSKTAGDFRRPPRPISTNWKAAYDNHFDLGDERDKKASESTVDRIEERIGGLIRSASAILPRRH